METASKRPVQVLTGCRCVVASPIPPLPCFCGQDAMLTSWQMPYWDLDFGPGGTSAGNGDPSAQLRNQPVQFQSLLSPSPPWTAAVMAATPPGRIVAATAARLLPETAAVIIDPHTSNGCGGGGCGLQRSYTLASPLDAASIPANVPTCLQTVGRTMVPYTASSRTDGGLNLFIIVPEGAAAALRCSPVVRELAPGATFH